MADQRTYPFLPDDKCLTEQQLFDYIDGKLSATEMHLAEKHLLDCNLCSDALEGLELVKHRGKVAAFSPDKFPEKIISKTSEDHQTKIIPLRSNKFSFYSIAAAIILIIGITVILKMSIFSDNNQASKLAENKNRDSSSAIISNNGKNNFATTDSISNSAQPILHENAGGKSDENGPAEKTASTDQRKIAREDENAKTMGVVAPQQNQAQGASSGQRDLQLNKTPVTLSDQEDDIATPTVDQSKNETVEAKAEEQTVDTKTVADKKSQKEKDAGNDVDARAKNADRAVVDEPTTSPNNAGASGKTNSLSAPASSSGAVSQTENNSVNGNSPSNNFNYHSVQTDTSSQVTEKSDSVRVQNSYESGMQFLNAGNANAALPYFDQVLKNPSDKNFENAQWEKSLALIQLNRKDEAKILLQAIAKKNGKYKTQAENKLKTL